MTLFFFKAKSGATFVFDKEKKHSPFVSLVPLLEILLEINQSPTKAQNEYFRLVENLGTEFEILLKKSYQEVENVGGEKLAQAVRIVRERKVFVDPGYDGVFGKVKIFSEKNNEEKPKESQAALF